MEKKNVTHSILVIAVIGVVSGLWYLNRGEQVQYAADTNTRQQESGQETANETVSLEQAQEIMGGNYIGPEDIFNAFGFTPENIPEIPFSRAELIRAKELRHQLILYVDTKDGKPFTLEDIVAALNSVGTNASLPSLPGGTPPNKGIPIDTGHETIVLYSTDTTARPGWRLTSPEITESTTDKNYLEQTEALITYLQDKVFAGQDLPEIYQTAIAEFTAKKEVLLDLMKSDEKEAAQQLSNLMINQITRENVTEVIYRLFLAERKDGTTHLYNTYTWTNSIDSDIDPTYGKELILVGSFEPSRAAVRLWTARSSSSNVGTCLSRGL